MRSYTKALVLVAVLAGGFAATSALHAEGGISNPARHGMMMGDDRGRGGMMGMMRQMSRMMDHCNSMMSRGHPNDQWRKHKSSAEDNG